MPLSNFLKSAASTCPFCNQKAGEHPECRRTYQAGWNEMVNIPAQASASHTFDEKSLRLSLAEIARKILRGREHRQPGTGRGLEAGGLLQVRRMYAKVVQAEHRMEETDQQDTPRANPRPDYQWALDNEEETYHRYPPADTEPTSRLPTEATPPAP